MLSLPVGTEMFHFPTFPPHALCVQAWVTGHDSCRVSPFGNPRITARLTAPRGLSQPPTSFIGSWCQGIHRAPLLTWPQRLMLASTVQFSRYGRVADPGSSRTATCRSAASVRRGLVPVRRRLRPRRGRTPSESEVQRSRPVPSGPNSVPGPTSPDPVRSCPPKAAVLARSLSADGLTGQCSTLEHHPRGIRPEHGSGHAARRLTVPGAP